MITVSVIVPSHGGAARLPMLMESLALQEGSVDFDIHVVVDEDVDGSEEVLEELAARYPNLNLEWTVFPTNQGRVAALNEAINSTSGAIIARCDDDLVPGPRYIETIAAVQKDGPIGAVGLYRNVYPETPYSKAYGVRHDEMYRQEAYDAPPRARFTYWHGNSSVPRTVIETIGLYDPRFRRYGWEDIDFGYRLHRAGVPIVLVPELETEHRIAATTTRIRAIRALHAGSARRAFLEKHGLELPADPSGPWGALVRAASAVSTEGTLTRVSEAVDRLLPHMPGWLAEKSVALVVESAGRAGVLHADRAKARF
ncbi:hypothetical protein BSZ39_09930 [Bowdeniella nasicola]|uniref:Glycosyltransferase 2-like domain-containing protein n=1 Tax=Bowdeniella nasicola TaxID=208480 RepID=A0A1Q5Q0T3_9ACTO|nr:glycosyltransferase [Bowdeniella nasicola]OKL53366.1 hypothetical protein BSZ39_09930 [Bowdeniella nasicola]